MSLILYLLKLHLKNNNYVLIVQVNSLIQNV